ncbi:MAG: DUF3352 domain-containing protein [Actinobacteria bacterium]|nr:DUF3352 domain-containing protein [Actinomycetota bacterium]
MKSKAVVLAIVGVLGVVAVGVAGVLGYQMFFGTAEDRVVGLVPQDAAVYGHIFLDPSMNQKQAIEDILEAFPEAPSFDEARNELVEALDEGLGEVDMNFEDDVEPWLGDQVGGFSLFPEDLASGGEPPPAALLVASDDDDAAQAFIDQGSAESDENLSDESYGGVDYKLNSEEGSAVGVVDGFVVIGSEAGLKAVVDVSEGESNLADDEDFSETTDALTDDRLATFYFDGRKLTEALEAGSGMPGGPEAGLLGGAGGLGLNIEAPVAAALFVDSDKVVLESTSTLNEETKDLASSFGGGLVGAVPADSWGALGLSDLGGIIEGIYDTFAEGFAAGGGTNELDAQFEAQTGLNLREDLLSWMGDAGLFVSGTDPNSISGGLLVESTDPAKSSETLATLEGLLQQQGLSTEPFSAPNGEGFKLEIPGSPQPVIVLGGERVVISFGEQAALDALEGGQALSGTETFQTAATGLGEGFSPAGYFDLDVIQTFAENTGVSEEPSYEGEIKPWIDPLSYLAFGSRIDGDRLVQRMVIGIE